MYLGRVVEQGTVEDIFDGARHPYTQALLSALPAPDPDAADSREHVVLSGDLPSAVDPPSGCHFHPRCPKARADCREQQPPLEPVDGDPPDHPAACLAPPRARGEPQQRGPRPRDRGSRGGRAMSDPIMSAPAMSDLATTGHAPRTIEGRGPWRLAWLRLKKDQVAIGPWWSSACWCWSRSSRRSSPG